MRCVGCAPEHRARLAGIGGFGDQADRWDEKGVSALRAKRDELVVVR